MIQTPAVSVVIIGRNEGARLERCLRSVQRMKLPGPVEVIYVDSASTDGSPAAGRLVWRKSHPGAAGETHRRSRSQRGLAICLPLRSFCFSTAIPFLIPCS